MLQRRILTLVACLGVLGFLSAPADAQTKLLRFPDLHGDTVVFTYAGDLWTAPATGGTATRLTSHPGLELFPRFSPDGQHIAFTGQYDGDEQVYVIPTAGGTPQQLTFFPARGPLPPRWGYDNQVYGWTPDGQRVLFRSYRDAWDLSNTKLYTVGMDASLPSALPMPESGAGDLSPDGSKIVYSPLARDFRHWKRYEGGWAQELYIFDLASHDMQRVTDHPRADRDPMWVGDHIYFASDRDDRLDLYGYDLGSGQLTQLTDHEPWDVRWPSADTTTGRIVYELDGELRIYDTTTSTDSSISIHVPTDNVLTRPSRMHVGDQITDSGLSPKGTRAVFAARGDIFTVPVEHGLTRNLTNSSGANDRDPAWSPDGKHIAFISDMDGEDEIYLIDQEGRKPAVQLTDGNTTRFTSLNWSPTSTHLAFTDQGRQIYVLDVASKELKVVADDPDNFGTSFVWSPRGGHLALSMTDDNGQESLHIWSAADNQRRRITSDLFSESSPSWDPGGNYLYYLSPREWHPQIGSFEFNYVVAKNVQVYALALRKDVTSPLPVRNDEVEVSADDEKKADNGDGDDEKKEDATDESPITIDFEGLAERVVQIPLPPDNYAALSALEGHLLYATTPNGYYGRAPDGRTTLSIYSLKEREATTLVEGLQGLQLSPDGSKMLTRENGRFQLRNASPAGKSDAKAVDTSNLVKDHVPAEEWAQIYGEVWRRFRDHFYDPNMHGYDWQALGDQYRPQLGHVGHRSDLNYVLSELIGELNISHAYVTGGDWDAPARPRGALLGARFETADDRYRIGEIFEGQNAEDAFRSPLTEVGVNVKVGDYMLAINGEELTADDNPYRMLRHAGGDAVELTVNSQPSFDGARNVLVRPVRSETSLLYLQWLLANHRYVNERSGGRLGYIHIPDMGSDGIREWVKWFYGQIRKQGMVIDVRNNGGGNISQMLIERLRRELLMFDVERNKSIPDTYPSTVFTGHLVCLLDEDTASDGDQFAYVFREAGLGPLIGKRSWGGVVGIYGRDALVDGGGVSVPESGSTDANADWVIEGYGVDPDIVVENEPKEVLQGRDQQLEKAVDVLLEQLEQDPRILAGRKPAPNRAPQN